jgi:hypothetical protein
MGISVDTKDFDLKFGELMKRSVPANVSKGMFRAGNELLRDAIYEVPKAPFDEGHLRASARTQLGGGVMIKFGTGAYMPPASVDARDGEGYALLAGFNIIYAARWHELTPEEDARINWTLPGSGRKYLETKLIRHKDKYAKIVADYLERLLRKGGK